MRGFESITNDNALAAFVREVTYDTRLFWYSNTEQQSAPYILALMHTGFGPEEYEEQRHLDYKIDHLHEWYRSENVTRYDKLYENQQQILEARHDFEVLSKGLSQLPSLQTVSMIGVNDDCPGFHQDTNQNCTGYEAWCKRFWPTIVPPWTWNQAAASGYKYKQHWDLRGIQSLLESISLLSPWITKFHYGIHLDPEKSLPEIVSSQIRSLAPNLTHLEICCTKVT